MIAYTCEQLKAIDHKGSLVITACPGSGKTAVIAEKIRRELDISQKYQGVIAITFTKKASKELESRCRLGNTNLKSSFFGTIDSFCLSEIIYPFVGQLFGYLPPDLKAKFDFDIEEHEAPLAKLLKTIDDDGITGLIDKIQDLYALGTIYFPTIPHLALHIHEHSEACRRYIQTKFTTIYIDEYQDSSKVQHLLFLSIVKSGIPGVAVGDLQQSIYGFRNCSPEYLKSLMDNPEFSHKAVSKNHRCHPSISNYANRLFNPTFDISPTDEIRIWHCQFKGTQRDTAVHLNSLIPAILAHYPQVPPSELAVLTPNNSTLNILREHLTTPCRIFSENSLDSLKSNTGSLWSALIKYKFDESIHTDELIDNFIDLNRINRSDSRRIAATVRRVRICEKEELEGLLLTLSAIFFNSEAKVQERAALKKVIFDDEELRQYHPANQNEVQCMTLHKSKGLEFEIVIHLDLTEWIFPRQIFSDSFDQKEYSCYDQDLNLHFVGITRAKSLCILGHTTSRLNSKQQIKRGSPSVFLSIEGLAGLFQTCNYP